VQPRVKAHSLTGRITPQTIREAWLAVRRNRGAAGIDKVSVAMFEQNLDANLDRLLRELKDGTFQPLPARRVYIPKAPGKFRPLGIPAVRDRVAQEMLRRLLNPLFERLFHDHSYGFRPSRSCHQAVEKVKEFHRQGYRVVLDADISGFFDNLSHGAILTELEKVVADGNIIRLVEKFLKAGVVEGGKYQASKLGTPQGGVVSPLLANIALNLMDWRLEEAGFRFVRYADDFVVLCTSHRQAQEALDLVQQLLKDQLGLTLSPEKTSITTFKAGFNFLGFRIGAWTIRMRNKSIEKFQDQVRKITTRSHNLDADMIEKLNRVIRGTANYFARPWSACVLMYRTLDRWTRMRLRCMKFKHKSAKDNRRLRLRYFQQWGLLSLASFIPAREASPRGSP
jgi:RNA-directed DNA polymerase